MIIFNLYAIAVVIICFIGCFFVMAVGSLIPGFEENKPAVDLVLFMSVTVFAGACELVGLKGRIFFLPIWLFSGIAALVKSYQIFGGLTLVGGVVALIGGFVLLGYFLELNEWKNAPGALAKCKQIQDVSSHEFWDKFKSALFIPAFGKCDAHVSYHNYECLELLKNHGIDWPVIDKLMNAYVVNTHDGPNVEIEIDDTNELTKLIDEQLEAFQA